MLSCTRHHERTTKEHLFLGRDYVSAFTIKVIMCKRRDSGLTFTYQLLLLLPVQLDRTEERCTDAHPYLDGVEMERHAPDCVGIEDNVGERLVDINVGICLLEHDFF